MDERADFKTASPGITAEMAVRTAIADKKLSTRNNFVPVSSSPVRVNFGKMDIASEDIIAELIWTPVQEGKKMLLTWQVYLMPKINSDYWMIRVDAQNGRIVDQNNLTVYCDWDDHKNTPKHTHNANLQSTFGMFGNTVDKAPLTNSPLIVNGASYRVIPYPAESPIHPGGAHALRTDPWTIAPGAATSLKWNSDGTDYDYTRGNNVWAYDDRSNLNNPSVIHSAMSSTTPDPLTFDFTPDYTLPPTQTAPAPNQQFNITNLFYWNNILHDLTYQYGFDEVAGNYQANNQGRGGAGNDYVMAEAQDGSGTNNANFTPSVDGVRGRMQMYLWSGSPQLDGDIDNGIILHEGTHGISNRLTGGPATASCLSNAEQMGEGWSDYFSLMGTQNWATSTVNDGFASPRGIGNYALNQPITGVGIRPARYTTNMAVNNYTYANLPSMAVPHGVGFVWCTILWDMTWKIIEMDGINPNLFNAAGVGGNTIAFKLVTEGMKLQPCSPGFVDGRNAILQADQILYNGRYACAIKEAFARRGIGANASQGSSASTSDQTVDFSSSTLVSLTQNVVTVPEGQNIVYTNTVTTCAAITNFLLTDTLPANVTYVSGGTYNAGTRVVSFPVNLATGATQTYTFTVNVNVGSYFPPVILLDEQVAGPAGAIPATWTATSTTANVWTVQNTRSHSPAFSFFTPNATIPSDQILAMTNAVALGATPPPLSFWHWYDTESTWDGGVLEISTDGGTTWNDMAANITQNGYSGTLRGTGNPLAGRNGWTGNSGAFIKTMVNLSPYANQSAKFRFRMGSDNSVAASGWNVDDILIKKIAQVDMRSSLFNTTGTRVSVSDTVTEITGSVGCTNAAITTQPANTSSCSGNNATITVAATGSALQYQWQVSTDAGVTFTNVAGATSATLTLTAVTAGMSGNQYKVIVSNACPSTVTSSVATLTVSSAATITSNPVNVTVCAGSNASFAVTATGSSLTYQWQVSTDAGATFTDIAGQTATTLNLTSVTTGQNNYQYRAVVSSCNPTGVNSTAATLTVNAPVAINASPASVITCENTNASFTSAATGTAVAYQWQISTNGGTTWTNIAGATSATYSLTAVTVAQSGNQFRAVVSGTCTTTGINTSAATLTVNSLVSISAQPVATAVCAGLNSSFSISAAGTGLTYQWQVSTNGGSTWTNIAGQTSAILNLTAVTTSMNGYQYRAVLNGTCTTNLISTAVTLTVNTPVSIVSQPAAFSACSGSNATFGISALGTTITYQWQLSINGGPFVNLANGGQYSGVTTNQLTVANVTTAMSGYVYRAVASGIPCGAVTSTPAKLTVNALPSVVATVAAYPRITPYVRTTISTTISPAGTYTYRWFRNSSPLTSVNTPTLPITVDGFGEYKVAVTDLNGCTSFSNNVTVFDSASNILFVYPNPNKGQFQVRYFNLGGGSVKRTIVVFDAQGNRVYSKAFNVSGPYGRMDVELPGVSGTFMVDVIDAAGKRLATGRVVVIQ